MEKLQDNIKEAMMQFTAVQNIILSLDSRMTELQHDMNYAIRVVDKLQKLMGDIEYELEEIIDPDGENLLKALEEPSSACSSTTSCSVGTSGAFCEKNEEEFPGMEEQNSIYDRVMRIKAERRRQAELDQQHNATQEQISTVDI